MSAELVENSVNGTSFFNISDLPQLTVEGIYVVAAVASISAAGYLIVKKYGIKISEITATSFFDADKGDYVQDRTYVVKWGNTFKKAVHLPHKFNSGSKLEAWYKPTTGPMDELTEEHYAQITKSNLTKIHLFDKGFYKEEEVEKIRIKTTTRINHEKLDGLMSKISFSEIDDKIIITNKNEEVIRNYPITMPSKIPISKGWEYVNTINTVVTFRIIPKSNTSESTLMLLVDVPKNSDGGRVELPVLI